MFVDVESGIEPVIHGTVVLVYAIAALARGQSVAEIMEDYPAQPPAEKALWEVERIAA